MTEQYYKVLHIMTMFAICMTRSAINRIAEIVVSLFSTGFKQTAIPSGTKITLKF